MYRSREQYAERRIVKSVLFIGKYDTEKNAK